MKKKGSKIKGNIHDSFVQKLKLNSDFRYTIQVCASAEFLTLQLGPVLLYFGELYLSWAINYLRNRKHVPCFYRVIETQVEVWENEKCCGNKPWVSVSTAFWSSSKTFTSVSIKQLDYSMSSRFLSHDRWWGAARVNYHTYKLRANNLIVLV